MAVPFPLNSVPGLFTNYPLPRGVVDPRGNWAMDWAALTVIGFAPGRSGRLHMSRQVLAEGRANLSVRYEKSMVDGYTYREEAEIVFLTDSLSTPVSWTLNTGCHSDTGALVGGTKYSASGTNSSAGITIQDGSGSRLLAISGARAMSWALIDAVMRLPRKDFAPLPFTLIDHYDQVKPDQILSFRGKAEIPAASGGTTMAWGYDQVGWGILPVTYYVDEGRRAAYIIAGIEVYTLESSAGDVFDRVDSWEGYQ